MVAALSVYRTWLGQRPGLVALFAAAALAPWTADSASLQFSPITPLDDYAPLTHEHPAFGAGIDSRVVVPVIFQDPNELVALGVSSDAVVNASSSGDSNDVVTRHRRVEATNRDIQRLEESLGESLERNFFVLRDEFSSGAASSIPWPSSYWPVVRDGINYAWHDDEPASSAKYARAFGKNVKRLQDAVSKSSGVLGQSGRKACKSNKDCRGLRDGSKCGIRAGKTKGVCIPTWYGICHAWAAAAIMEPEPRCAIERNGVLFRPFDIKALLSQVYDGADVRVVFTGARFGGPDSPTNTDTYGRYADAARRDLNPSFLHLAVANLLGKHSRSFIVDVASNSEVWNQPVRSYEVTEMELVDVEDESLAHFGVGSYPFNSAAKYLARTVLELSWIDESGDDGEHVGTGLVDQSTVTTRYEYLLELDGSYNIIGGEWLDDSRANHPDFLWFPASQPDLSTELESLIEYGDIAELLAESVQCSGGTSDIATTRHLESAGHNDKERPDWPWQQGPWYLTPSPHLPRPKPSYGPRDENPSLRGL